MPLHVNRLGAAIFALLLVLQPGVSAAAVEPDLPNQPPAEQWWLTEFGFQRAWSVSRGEGVTIAVIDTGIDAQHPDLNGRIAGGTDFSGVGTPDGLTPVGSASHHGTMVASLIAGQGQASGGVWGVAPDAELISVSIGLGVPGANTDKQVAAAIRWAVDAGAEIINLSLSRSSSDWPRSWDDALLYAFQSDVIVVAALGSAAEGKALASAPGTIPGVVSVAGLSRGGEPTEPKLSSVELDVLAPGEELLGSYPGGGVRSWEGASAAAPLVSGLLALMLAADPNLNAAQAIANLRGSARDAGVPGFEAEWGYGIIDAEAALVTNSNSVLLEDPATELERWISLYRPSQIGADPDVTEGSESLILPPEPGLAVTVEDSLNPPFSADSSLVIPLLLAVFGFGFAISVVLIVRSYGTRKTRKS